MLIYIFYVKSSKFSICSFLDEIIYLIYQLYKCFWRTSNLYEIIHFSKKKPRKVNLPRNLKTSRLTNHLLTNLVFFFYLLNRKFKSRFRFIIFSRTQDRRWKIFLIWSIWIMLCFQTETRSVCIRSAGSHW